MTVRDENSNIGDGRAGGNGLLARLGDFQQVIALIAAILGIFATFQSTRNSTRLGDIESRLSSLREERSWAKELYSQFDAIVSKGTDDQARVDRLAGLLALTELTDQPRVKEQLSLLIKQQAARYEALLAAQPTAKTPEGQIQLQQYRQLQRAAVNTALTTHTGIEQQQPAPQRRQPTVGTVPTKRDAGPRPDSAPPRQQSEAAATHIRFPKGFSLDQLERQITMMEMMRGPLTGLGMTEEGTMVTFTEGIPPGGRVKLTAGSVPEGYRRIWQGQIWVENQRQTVAASRAN